MTLNYFSLLVVVSHPVPLAFGCDRSWNEIDGTFQFQVSWTLPSSNALIDFISGFEVQVQLNLPEEADGNHDRLDINSTYAFNVSQYLNFVIFKKQQQTTTL